MPYRINNFGKPAMLYATVMLAAIVAACVVTIIGRALSYISNR